MVRAGRDGREHPRKQSSLKVQAQVSQGAGLAAAGHAASRDFKFVPWVTRREILMEPEHSSQCWKGI